MLGFVSRVLSLLYCVLKPVVHLRIGLIRHRSIGSLTGNTEYFLRCEKMITSRQWELKILVSGHNPVNRQIITMLKRCSLVIESDWLWNMLNNIRLNHFGDAVT